MIQDQCAAQIAGFDAAAEDAFSDTVFDVQLGLEHALIRLFGSLTTEETWRRYELAAHEEALEQQRQHDIWMRELERQRWQARQFWETHFADVIGMRVEVPQFRSLSLESRLREILLDTDPETVDSIAALGLPGDFSNSVQERIRKIAQAAKR